MPRNATSYKIALAISAVMLLWPVMLSPPASACSPAGPSLYNVAQGAADPPPKISIRDIKVKLGCRYGGPGPGDCSELGRVILSLSTPDGKALDGLFGVRINVLSGRIPVVRADAIDGMDLAVENNQVRIVIADTRDYVKFQIRVQAVNKRGARGPLSETRSVYVKNSCIRVGCLAFRWWHLLPVLCMGLLGFGLVWLLRRRRR